MPQVEILFLKNAGKWGKGAVGGIGCSNRLIFSVREYVFFIRVWVYRWEFSLSGDVREKHKGKPEHYRNGINCCNSLENSGMQGEHFIIFLGVATEVMDPPSWKEPPVPSHFPPSVTTLRQKMPAGPYPVYSKEEETFTSCIWYEGFEIPSRGRTGRGWAATGLGGCGDQRGRRTRRGQWEGLHRVRGSNPGLERWARTERNSILEDSYRDAHWNKELVNWAWIPGKSRILSYNFLKLVYPPSSDPRDAAVLMLQEELKKHQDCRKGELQG